MKLQFEQQENEKNRQKDIMVAEIRAAGFGAQSDINENMVSDYADAMKDMKETSQYREQMDMKREENVMKQSNDRSKIEVEKERLKTQQSVANTNLEIARENKNKYDVQSKKEKSKKKNKK